MKKKVTNFLGVLLFILALVFIVRRMMGLDMDFSMLWTPTNLAMLAVMPFLSVTVVFSNAYCWKRVLSLFTDQKIPPGDAFAAYAKSNVMKYLPGNVGHYVGRQIFGARIGVGQTHLAVASVLEIGYAALSMLLCAGLFSARQFIEEIRTYLGENAILWACLAMGCGIAAALALMLLLRKNKYVKSIWELLLRPRFWCTLIFSTFMFSLASSIFVAEYVVLLGQYTTFDFEMMGIIMSSNFIAIFIGYVTPGVPGGIGVREAVLLAMLSPYFSSDVILLASMTQRIISIVGDVIAAPVSLLFSSESLSDTVNPNE